MVVVRSPRAEDAGQRAAILAAMERHFDAAVTDEEAAAAAARLLGGNAPARGLVAAVAQAALDSGCERMEWITDRGNALARAAYRAMGAVEGDKVTYRVGFDALARLAATGHADTRPRRRPR